MLLYFMQVLMFLFYMLKTLLVSLINSNSILHCKTNEPNSMLIFNPTEEKQKNSILLSI